MLLCKRGKTKNQSLCFGCPSQGWAWWGLTLKLFLGQTLQMEISHRAHCTTRSLCSSVWAHHIIPVSTPFCSNFVFVKYLYRSTMLAEKGKRRFVRVQHRQGGSLGDGTATVGTSPALEWPGQGQMAPR